MLHEFRLKEDFFASLVAFDAEIARQVAAEGCRHCGGPLHQAHYARKPRGGLVAPEGEAQRLRHSLCCGRRGCRKRALPPSLRFLGRKVYLGAVVLLASVTAQLTRLLAQARATTGVPGRTLRRWAAWWQGSLPVSRTWSELCARFIPPPPAEEELPRSLVDRLQGELERQQESCPSREAVCLLAARCLAPLTTGSVPDGSRFVRDVGNFGRVS